MRTEDFLRPYRHPGCPQDKRTAISTMCCPEAVKRQLHFDDGNFKGGVDPRLEAYKDGERSKSDELDFHYTAYEWIRDGTFAQAFLSLGVPDDFILFNQDQIVWATCCNCDQLFTERPAGVYALTRTRDGIKVIHLVALDLKKALRVKATLFDLEDPRVHKVDKNNPAFLITKIWE